MEKKYAVVTGGSRGIGAEIVRELCRAGCDVIANYRSSSEKAETLCRETEAEGYGRAIPFCADISQSSEARRLISKAIMEFGRIDILVNNAGVSSPGTLLDTDDEELERVMKTNFCGTFFCTRAAAREMINSGCGGAIVNISSMWGICGASGEAVYSASKAAVINLTKSLAKELAPEKILVNCIAPGVINTDMNSCYDAQTMDELKKRTPLGRLGEPCDVARAVRFLSLENTFITGQTLCVDGGFIL